MTNTTGTELAIRSTTSESKTKKISRTVFAGVMSMGLIGTVAFPAFAAAQPDDVVASVAPATQPQTLTANKGAKDSVTLFGEQLQTAVEPNQAILLREEKAAEEARLIEAQEAQERSTALTEVVQPVETQSVVYAPMPESSSPGLSQAAYAQLGIVQDCTDLVQNSLAALGRDTRRDQGGYDRGPQLGDWTSFGTQIPFSRDAVKEGDILVYPGKSHVAIALNNSQAVHGGWQNNTTMLGGFTAYAGDPVWIIR